MTSLDIAQHRLHNQHLARTWLEQPADVVQWLGAVQAQDYAGAKWALGLRLPSTTDADVEQALTKGVILRTHVLRPTWHFVTPDDIRWLLALTAPRVNAVNGYYYRKLGLDESVFKRSNAALTKALQGNKHLTREELRGEFKRASIAIEDNMRLSYLLMRAELDGIVCSGARRGKQFTYALLEERITRAKTWERDEALMELTLRYFASRGPATLRDFVWWSGLTMADAKKGTEHARSKLEQAVIDGQTYWFAAAALPAKRSASPVAYLLPNYDEYFIGFKDRSAILRDMEKFKIDAQSGALSAHIIVINGQVVGGWKRIVRKTATVVELNSLRPLTQAENRAVNAAVGRYSAFLDQSVAVEVMNLDAT